MKFMEYNFKFRQNEDNMSKGIIEDTNSFIEGRILTDGTVILNLRKEKGDFKKYCDDNDIEWELFGDIVTDLITVNYKDINIEGLPDEYKSNPQSSYPKTDKPLKEKTMEYNFKFHESKDIRVHSDTIYDSNNNIAGVIQSDGTVILDLKKEKEEFKKYCDNNNIKWNLFIGDDTGMIVVNYKDLNIEGLPQGYVKEFCPNPEDFESNTEEINEAGELPFEEENNEPLKTDTIETEDKKWITYKETKSEEDYNIEYILLEEFIDSIMHELQGERIDDFLYLIFLLHEKRDAMYTQKTDGSFASKFILKIISSSEKNYLQAVILADGQNTIYYPKNKEIYINKDIDSNIGDSLCISYNTDKQISSICTDLIKLNEDSLYTLLKVLTQNYKIEKVNNEYILTQEMIMG